MLLFNTPAPLHDRMFSRKIYLRRFEEKFKYSTLLATKTFHPVSYSRLKTRKESDTARKNLLKSQGML